MSKRGVPPAILLTAFFAAALLLRSSFGYGFVFRSDGVSFQEGDAWFHMRTIQNLLHHFPWRSGFDPYSAFPTGQPVPTGPFFDYAIGVAAWVAGVGSPSPELSAATGAWFPAILGALITVPVYFLGRTLFDSAAGLWAAALVAIFPGRYLRVSLLGFTDHHVAESLLYTLVLLFLVLALRRPHPARYSILTGLALGCFLATRPAGGFLAGVLALWAVAQCCLNHLDGVSSGGIWRIVVPALIIAWLVFLPVGDIVWSNFARLALGAGIAAVTVAVALSHVLRSRGAPKWVFFFVLTVLMAGGIALLHALRPQLAGSLARTILTRTQMGPERTVRELVPLLQRAGRFSLWPAWDEFAAAWFLALPALFLTVGRTRWSAAGPRVGFSPSNRPARAPAADQGVRPTFLFNVCTVVLLAATLLQYRMIGYLAVNIAVMTGAAAAWLLAGQTGRGRLVSGAVLAGVLLGPNIALALKVAQRDTGVPQAWRDSLAWLRSHTPEPMDDASAFDRYYPRLAPDVAFSYPGSAYGIMNWWDHGHWISAIGRRIPVSNPMQTGAGEAARFFTATEPARAIQILRQNGARYIVADNTLPMRKADGSPGWLGAFRAMPVWAGERLSDYFEVYRSAESGDPQMVFYPAYYRSLLVRLYAFDGEAVQPASSTWVIQYRQQENVREIISSRNFPTYDEAARYIEAHPGERLILGGLNPTRSCVPLEKLDQFRLAHASPPGAPGASPTGTVKIFEYSGR